jgi:hypothetical protein
LKTTRPKKRRATLRDSLRGVSRARERASRSRERVAASCAIVCDARAPRNARPRRTPTHKMTRGEVGRRGRRQPRRARASRLDCEGRRRKAYRGAGPRAPTDRSAARGRIAKTRACRIARSTSSAATRRCESSSIQCLAIRFSSPREIYPKVTKQYISASARRGESVDALDAITRCTSVPAEASSIRARSATPRSYNLCRIPGPTKYQTIDPRMCSSVTRAVRNARSSGASLFSVET